MINVISWISNVFKVLFLPFSLVDKLMKIIADSLTPHISDFVNWILIKLGIQLTLGDHFNEAVNFFIYDSFKIIILLSIMIFIISYVRSYFPPEKVKKMLSKFNGIWANVVASVLGVLSPF